MFIYNGIYNVKVVKSNLAFKTKYIIKKFPIKKRRRNWFVKRIEEPTAIYNQLEKALYVHPEIYKELMKNEISNNVNITHSII